MHMSSDRIQAIKKVFKRVTSSHKIFEAVLLVENTKGDFSCSNEYGGKNVDSPLLMASITKLFTTTCILKLRESGRLTFDDKLTKYFDASVLNGLHVYKGTEYSFGLTIYDLIFQTSGLPDVYEETSQNLKGRLIKEDSYVGFDDMIAHTKALNTHFLPQIRKRAHYADVNFDILGEIIEKITGLPLDQAYEDFIFKPLGLNNTYLPVSENDFIPSIYYKDESIYRPQYVMCSRASGGCISTAKELMIFIKAFFGGKLFDKDVLNTWEFRKLQMSMSPIGYGCGHMHIPLGGASLFFQGVGELVGHSGSTGSLAFYYPHKDLFFVGDVNQMSNPAIPVRMAIQLALAIK